LIINIDDDTKLYHIVNIESKKGRKISVEIRKNWATIYWNWASILSCYEGISILEKSSRGSISRASEVNLDLMMKSSHNLLGSGHHFSVTESVSIKAKLVFDEGVRKLKRENTYL